MMAGGITHEGALGGGIFAGKKFFLTQRVPLRDRFVKEIEASFYLSSWSMKL
jgi:hypothetical protein